MVGLMIVRISIVSILAALQNGLASTGPCDLFASGQTPCVAAHSTVRALYGNYNGFLYQVRRSSDNATYDIGLLTLGGYANSAEQDQFCANTTCVISKIYDQSPNGNHLTVTPPGGWLPNGGKESDAFADKIMVNGHAVYGVYIFGNGFTSNPGAGYRNNNTTGIATGDQPEGIYMVANGNHYNSWCCFDYGNAETSNTANGPATMEAVFFGNSIQWGRGSGEGPWVMADLEEGLFAGVSFDPPPSNTPLLHDFVTGMLKGDSSNLWSIRGGNAQSGNLKTLYSGPRPTGYHPMKKEGAIVLGIGGDNSSSGEGTFYEGCITTGYPSDETEDAVQANIVAAGYGLSQPVGPGATFFQFSNFGGLSATLAEGSYTLGQLQSAGIPDNAITSMKVDPGLVVDLFDADNFQVSLGSFQANVPDFNTLNLGNKITSIRIHQAPTHLKSSHYRNTMPLHWAKGVLYLPNAVNGQIKVTSTNGKSWVFKVNAGNAPTGSLPNGIYHALFLGRGNHTSNSFIVNN